MRNLNNFLGLVFFLAISVTWTSRTAAAEKLVYSFQAGSDGALPRGALVADNSGNLLGTTYNGGGGTGCLTNVGCGTVFELGPDGTEKLLHAFVGGCDGAYPLAGLVRDGRGNYFGTTSSGGVCNSDAGFGTVFEVASDGTETALYSFQGGSDGSGPVATLLLDDQGNLFGVTGAGGNFNGMDCEDEGCGTVFELNPNNAKVTLYAFQGGMDGASPLGPLIADENEDLYGVTSGGGGGMAAICGFGCGTVYRIAANGAESVLYAFAGSSDGAFPVGKLVFDTNGNLYGATSGGGTCSNNNDCGAVFKLSPDGSESVVYAFQGGSDGEAPEAGLIMTKSGDLYGTTYFGGGGTCRSGCGTVFKVGTNGVEKVPYAFPSSRHGRNPTAELLAGKNGILWGTTTKGGADKHGLVFEIRK